MSKLFTLVFTFNGLRRTAALSGLLLWLSPLLGWSQTTIVNYDFNSATAYPVAPLATAPGIASAATSSEIFTAYGGTGTGTAAYTPNATGPALGMSNSNGTNTRYFQFSLDGAALPKYSAFKIYLQGQRPTSGATTLTLRYSVNGGAYQTFGPTYAPGVSAFTEGGFDLSGLATLAAPTSLVFQVLASGASGSSTLRIDNFQVQAVNTVDPTIGSITPNTVSAGGPDQVIALTGSNFGSESVVSFNGQNLLTTYNSTTSLTATIPVALLAAPGSYSVVVTNPAAGGGSSSAAVAFVVTTVVPRWVGKLGSSWFEPTNWSTGAVPAATDDVLLDHSFVAVSYSVSFDQNTAVSVQSLTVNPGVGDSIFVVVPVTNTVSNALTLSNVAAGSVALAIYNKGVVTNASGASSGAGIEVAGSGPTAFIYNGGSYRQASSTTHRLVVENLSTAAGTEQGIFDFRLPNAGTRSYVLSVANRTYGTLILRTSPNQAPISYPAGSANSLTIQGNLLVGPGVTFTPTVGGDMRVGGDIRVQGSMTVSASTAVGSINQMVLSGAKPQLINGTINLAAGIGLVISNPTGVVLATPLLLNGPLTLTSGLLTTTGLLTLSTTASLGGSGGSKTSFVNGTLARQTAAGALTNLLFPTGSGAAYRPVVLNATAQDITTYLVTQKEAPAADSTNFLAGTVALPTLTRVSRVRSYTITPTPAANNFSGTATLSFDADDNVNQPNNATFTLGKNSSGAGWQNIGKGTVNVTTAATATTTAVGTITSQVFTSFSDFALASTNADPSVNPLPVTLTDFGAVRQPSGAVQVRWATASEQRSAYFEVQRSTNGRTFTAITQVAASGTTSQTHSYARLDSQAPAGVLYYRLRQVDTDGTTVFSPLATLDAVATATLSLYPNPARNYLTVGTAAGQQVQVLDLAGRVLQTSTLPASGELRLDALPAGTYLLGVSLPDGQRRTLRFTKE